MVGIIGTGPTGPQQFSSPMMSLLLGGVAGFSAEEGQGLVREGPKTGRDKDRLGHFGPAMGGGRVHALLPLLLTCSS